MIQTKQIRGLYKDLPSDIFKEVNVFTSDSTVALLAYGDDNHWIEDQIASGSLVTINSIYGVLTARHVWQEFKKRATKISFCVYGGKHYLHERLDYLKVYLPNADIDICFIEIPPTILGTIKAKMTFYPIQPDNVTDIEAIKNNLWVSVGFPFLIQSKEERVVNIFRYYTHLVDYKKIADNWDIIELAVQTTEVPENLSKSFEGMSGGGIWNFKVFFNDDTGEREFFLKTNTQDSVLVGVNFYQNVSENKICKISGVGPLSIYSGLTKLVVPSK